jgi:hypothetical protein
MCSGFLVSGAANQATPSAETFPFGHMQNVRLGYTTGAAKSDIRARSEAITVGAIAAEVPTATAHAPASNMRFADAADDTPPIPITGIATASETCATHRKAIA